jgi:hypothetical protein
MQCRESKLVQFDLHFSDYTPCFFAHWREAFHNSFFWMSKRLQSTGSPCDLGGVGHCFRDRTTEASSIITAIAAKRGSSKEEAIAFTDKTTEQRHQNLFFYIGLTWSGNVRSKRKMNSSYSVLMSIADTGTMAR